MAPSYKEGSTKKDVLADLFDGPIAAPGQEHLDLNLSTPPDRPPFEGRVVKAFMQGKGANGEDWVGYPPNAIWSAAQFYRVNGSSLYPRFGPTSKLRNSNFDQPPNHVRTVLFIGKQAPSEKGQDTLHALQGWTDPAPRVGIATPGQFNRADMGKIIARGSSTGGILPMNMNRIMLDPLQHTLHKDSKFSEFGGNSYATRYGFTKNNVNMTQFGQYGYACPVSGDRFDYQVKHTSDYGPYKDGGGQDKDYSGPAYEACLNSINLSITQYTLPDEFASPYGSTKLDEDHTYEDQGLHMSHMTCASSPFFWLGTEHWRTILERQGMDMMPFTDPLTDKTDDSGWFLPSKTRPINYRFWDGRYSTAMYGGPRFHCAMVSAPNTGGSLPDIQSYRDAMIAFTTDETSLMKWHASLDGHPEDKSPVENWADPGNYAPMEGSGTTKDVEYAPGSTFFKHQPSMGKRRQLHFRKMCHVNPNAVRDYRNTFCV